MKTIQEQENYIREACIKANPSIKDLVFGCLIRNKNLNSTHYSVGELYEQVGYFHQEMEKVLILNPEYVEIIGREIRLADVLFTLQKARDIPSGHITICEHGTFHSDENEKGIDWNLLKDYLSDQSDETKTFIFNLLSTKS